MTVVGKATGARARTAAEQAREGRLPEFLPRFLFVTALLWCHAGAVVDDVHAAFAGAKRVGFQANARRPGRSGDVATGVESVADQVDQYLFQADGVGHDEVEARGQA